MFQISIVGMEWILGVGLMFGLAFVLNYITYNNTPSFFIFLTIFCGFVVWAELLPLWTLILCLMILVIILFFQMKSQGGSDQ